MFFVCKEKTAYEMRISDWSTDVCSADLLVHRDATDRQADKLRLQRGRSALGVMAAELEVDGQAVGGLPVEPRLTQHGAQAVRLLARRDIGERPVGIAERCGKPEADRKSTRLNSSH